MDPFKIREEEWLDDPNKWPPVEFGQIHSSTYLIESPGRTQNSQRRG